jgi:hypothetical protein
MRKRGPKGLFFSTILPSCTFEFLQNTSPPRNKINKKYKKKRRNVLPVEQHFAADGSIHANTFVIIIIRAR